MAQRNQPERKVRFTITPEQAASQTSKRPGFRKFLFYRMGSCHQQVLTEKEQFFKWAEASKAKTCKLEELLINQSRQIRQVQEKLGPESHNNTQQGQASPQTPPPTMTWANVVKGQGKAKQLVTQREDQASSETPAPTMTSASVTKDEEEVKQPVIQSEDQASSQTGTAPMNWADVMEAEDEVREQLMLREAEVSQLKLENKGLLAMLQEAKNLHREPDHEEKEALKMQVKFLENKKSLQEDNNKLQEDKQAVVEKTKELEGKIRLIEHNNIPLVELISQMKEYIKTLQTEKTQLEDLSNLRSLQIRSIEKMLFQESRSNQETKKSVEFVEEQIAITDQEVHRITGINDSLSAALFKAEELLLEAVNEIEEKEQTWKTEHQSLEQLRKDVALKEKDNQELLKKQKETDDLQEKIRQLEENNQELQELWIQKKNKKTLFQSFRRTKGKKSNKKQTEEVIEETEEQREQEKEAENKKKSFWSWFKSDRKVEEAAGSSA